MPSSTAEIAQIEKLIGSLTLHGSESLCKLLRYLAERAMDQPGVPVKEYQIATEVFGRPRNFDPRLDSTVRVQTGRLRAKLQEYYSTKEGNSDPVLVEIPKGAYLVSFVRREPPVASAPVAAEAPPLPVNVPEKEHPSPRTGGRWKTLTFIFGGLSAAAIAVIFALTIFRPAQSTFLDPDDPETVSPALETFWKPFVEDPQVPWAVFSNAAFVGRPETGLRYFNPLKDSKAQIMDHYTGVGEVLAIHELDRIFTLLHHGIRVKRGRLLSLDDAKNNNLIFIGSPSENLTLREIPSTHDFVFSTLKDGSRKGDLAILRVEPRPGEQPYFISAPGLPLVDDYALIGLVPGINPVHWIMILAGTTTIGTQAAVEYVCHANTLGNLLNRLKAIHARPDKPFEGVLHVRITGGVPVESELVALRAES